LIFLAPVFAVISLAAAASEPDPRLMLLDSMATELHRNQAELKLQGHEPPYFIGYQVKQGEQYEIAARYGALFQNDFNRDRKLYVEVRVGSYEFDNSIGEDLDFNFSLKGNSYITYKNGPIDDDPMALRTALWLITDERYKNALFNYLKKKGENVYSVDNPKKPPSFSREKPVEFVQSPVDFSFDRQRWTRLARDLSGRFKSARAVFDSEVRISAAKIVRYHVSTEGSRLVTEQTLYGVHIQGVTRAEDGQLLEDSRDFYSAIEGRLPSDLRLSESTEKLISELLALREAPAIDPYTGPAILEPAAAGVLFHETIGHRLEGERQDDDAAEGKTFRGQVGRRVLPGFISIYDDPTVSAVRGEGLNGFYRYDEEGVPAQRATLVEDGILRSYILSRHPVEGFLHSNGHGRSQGNRKPMARMANLIIDSKKQVSDAELKTMLIAEAKRQGKPYGLIIRDITGGSTNTSTFGYQAFKGVPRMVYRVDVRDGKETLVRGVEIVGTPLSSINKIMATGKAHGVFNGFCGAESGHVPVSTVAPPTLLQEIELQRAMEGKDRPPLLESPTSALKKAER